MVSNVVWACGRLGYATERLSTWAVGQLEDGQALRQASPQALSNLAWGLSRLGHRPQPLLMAEIGSAALRWMKLALAGGRGFKPQELSALLSALGTWGARPDAHLLSLTEAELFASKWLLSLRLAVFFFSNAICR
jgi:hypothetical protein